MRKTILGSAASIIALAISSPVLAQEAETVAGQALDENVIIVTGLKRDETLQDINVAATVISGDDLAERGIERFDDLQAIAPSLSVTDAGLTQSVNIRGVGLASGSPAAANGVATYFDGLFQPPIVTTNSFYDIGSIEVFRGPQGTFVGSNSTGGAVFINSRDPEFRGIGGYVSFQMGNYDHRAAEGAINVPVSNTFAIRGAGLLRSRESYYTRTDGRAAPAKLEEKGGRLGFLWEPSTNFSALIKGEIAEKNTGGYAYRPVPGTAFAAFRTDDIRLLNYNSPTRNDEKAEQVSTRLEYRTDGGTTFRAIGGLQRKRIWNLYDSDAVNVAPTTQDQFVQEKVKTAEFNVISPDDQRLRWIAGGYFQRNNIIVDITNDEAFFPIDIDIVNRKTTTGLFAQVTYDLTDALSVDVGGRYSTYDVTGEGAVRLRFVGPPPGLQVADTGGAYDDDQFTGKVALNFQPNPDHLFYGFVAKGYKSGGFSSPTDTFDPEKVWDYELGWKGTFAGGAVTTQLGAFYYDYKDFQLDALDAATGRASLINLTNATIKGIEAQVQAKLGGFDFSAGGAYTDSSLSGVDFVDTRDFAVAFPGVNNVPQCQNGQTQESAPPYICVNYAPFIRTTDGGPSLYSPEFTFNASIAYTIYAGDLELTPQLSYSHTGDRFAYIGYDPVRDLLPAYDLLNANLGIVAGRFGFDLYATNLLDEEFVSGQFGDNEFYGAPREYGVRARIDF